MTYGYGLVNIDGLTWFILVLCFIAWDRLMSIGIAILLGVELEEQND